MITKLVLHLRPDMKASAEPQKETTQQEGKSAKESVKELNWESFKDYLLDNFINLAEWFDPVYEERRLEWRIKLEKQKDFPALSVMNRDGNFPAIAPFINSLLATIGKADPRAAGWDPKSNNEYFKFPSFDMTKNFGDYFTIDKKMIGSKKFGGASLKLREFDEWKRIFEKWKS